MEITWLGHSCFRLRGREATVVLDPPSPTLGVTVPRFPSNVVTISHDHPGHNDASYCSEPCRVIRGPGEYEVAGVFITGVQTYHDDQHGALRGKNVAFSITLDDITVCHLGDLGHTLTAAQKESLGAVDVLLVPVGGHSTITATQAAELAAAVEPKLVVPMHYRETAEQASELAPVDLFLKEMGRPTTPPQPRLVVTKATLPAEMQVAVLEISSARGSGR